MLTEIEKLNLNSIRKLREKNGLTKSDMAKRLGFKTTEKYSRRENGEYNFQVDELPIMAAIFKVSMEKFFSQFVVIITIKGGDRMSKEKRAEQIECANVYPNKLEDILADIEKIESKYSLRPRQFESVVQFSHRYLQKKDELRQ